jgi:putative MATE family efflux protein
MDALPDAPLIAHPPPKFVTGSLLRHILVMSGAGGIGLVAIFLADLANILFLSWLNDEAIVAAAGYASSILFFTTSVGIGLSIAASSLVSPALGAGNRAAARRFSVNAHLAALVVSVVFAIVIWLAIPWLMTLLGATGRAHALGTSYLSILMPSTPLLSLAITSAAVLRSAGDAGRAMSVTLWGAVANAILDPILIFGFDLGIEGAAYATTIARFVFTGVGLYGVIRVHDLMSRPRLPSFLADVPPVMKIAVPAILTNVATPVSSAYVTAAIAVFGDGAVAGWAIIGRVMPVAYGAVYALSGSIGPIIGQNYGAGSRERMRQSFTLALVVTGAYSLAVWLVLALAAGWLVGVFRVTGEAAALVRLFCIWLAPLFAFLGAMFVANAAFNVLGRAHYSTFLNWGRATLGTIPLVHAGGALAGAPGVLTAHMLGSIVFGVMAVFLCYRLIDAVMINAMPDASLGTKALERI